MELQGYAPIHVRLGLYLIWAVADALSAVRLVQAHSTTVHPAILLTASTDYSTRTPASVHAQRALTRIVEPAPTVLQVVQHVLRQQAVHHAIRPTTCIIQGALPAVLQEPSYLGLFVQTAQAHAPLVPT